MAERRMFAKTIIDSDAFLDMPVTARLLYYDLAMRADDDGFVNSPKKIMRMIGASQDDLGILAMRKFIIPFDNGIVVIKHWRIHNYIRKDTYNETTYKEQKEQLKLDENKAYTLVDAPSTDGLLPVDTGKVSIGKDSIGNINTPLTPLGEDEPKPKEEKKDIPKYDYSKHSNVENACYILNFLNYKEKDWLLEHKDTWECIRVWLKYKDERKDKYKGEMSLSKLFTMFVNNVRDYGLETVSKIVDESIASGYQGVAWDKLLKYPKAPKKQNFSKKNQPESKDVVPADLPFDEWVDKLSKELDKEEQND